MPVLLQNPIVNCLQILVGHFQARPVRPVRPFPLTRLPSPQPHIWTAWPSADGLQSSQSGLARCEHWVGTPSEYWLAGVFLAKTSEY